MKYRFNGRTLDVGARTVSDAGGAASHVEPQVFDLIRHLVENRARVVDRDELIARVWKGRVVSDATIASRINAARRAVGDDGRRQAVIATLSGRGFRFVAEVEETGAGLGQPAVAVMPFTLPPDDPGARHLARGLADQLAATLGQAAWFDVRDTAASFAEGFTGMAPHDVAEALNAGYLVMGALQTAGEAIRLSVRLTDPQDDRQIWSETYSGTRDEIFDIQDRMARQILGGIEPRLRHMELQKSAARHGSFTAFDHYLRATDALRAMDLPAMKAARDELDRALVANPDYPAAHGMHAWIGTLLLPQGWRVDPRAEAEHYRAAVARGRFDCDALAMGGYALGYFERDPAAGLGYLQQALAINPNSARAHDHAGWLLLYAGRASEALSHFDRALTLCPIDEFSFRMLTGRAFARLFLGDHEGAAADGARAHAAARDYTVCHRVLAAALAHLGRASQAQAIVAELLSVNPGLTVARYQRETRFDGPGNRETLFSGLRAAGLS